MAVALYIKTESGSTDLIVWHDTPNKREIYQFMLNIGEPLSEYDFQFNNISLIDAERLENEVDEAYNELLKIEV